MEVIEQDLTCSMCFEIFKIPKALPCLHTFCLECLRKYVSSQASVIAQKGEFTCPLCRVGTRPPEPINTNINKWADSFANNHHLSSMIENLQKAQKNNRNGPTGTSQKSGDNNRTDCIRNGGVGRTGRTSTPMCSICQFMVGCRWCEQCCQNICAACEKLHSQNPDAKVHVVVDAPNLHLSSDSSLGAAEKDQVGNHPCTQHLGKHKSFYCIKCSLACCSVCVAADHSTCFRILPMQQAIQNKIQLAQVYTSIIGLQKDNLKHLQGVVSTKLQENSNNHERLCREILSVRPMIDKILAVEEKRLLDDLNVKTMMTKTQLDLMQMACQNSFDILNTKGEVLQSTLEMNTVEQLHFLNIWDDISEYMNKNSSQHQDIKVQLEQLHTSCIHFEKSPYVNNILKDAKSSLGSLVDKNMRSTSAGNLKTPSPASGPASGPTPAPTSGPNPGLTPGPARLKLKSSRNLKLESEVKPVLTGICLLPDDVVVMCDFNNSKLKMFDQQRRLKYCIFPTNPYGVTYKPDSKQLIVSLPSSQELAYVSTSLEIEKQVKVLKEYSALSFNRQQRTLVCSSTSPACIDILYDDVLIRTLCLGTSRRPLFGEPEYLSLHPNQNIIVSDWDRKALFYVDNKGTVISSFTGDLGVNELSCPLGIAIDPNGSIYLADKEASRIFRFSADLKFEAIILTQVDHINQPMAMAFDSRGHLFVTEHSGYLKLFG